MAAFDPIGIGELWTGIALGGLGMLLFITVAVFTEFFSVWPWSNWDDEYDDDRRARITRGVLMCDWVDADLLASVAKQKKVPPDPVRLERGQSTATGGSARLGKRLRLGRTREKRTDEKSYFEMSKDPNDLLGKVLFAFSQDEEMPLLDNLDALWGGGPLTGDTLDQIIRAAKGTPGLEDAREAVQKLQSNAIKEQKLDEWRRLSEQSKFVLVESQWWVKKGDGTEDLWLRLQRLRLEHHTPLDYYDPPGFMQYLDMPEDAGIYVRLPAQHLTEHGEGRLVHDSRVTAGVFGTTGSFDSQKNALYVTPIAVFNRVEG